MRNNSVILYSIMTSGSGGDVSLNFGRGRYKEHFSEIILNSVVQEKMSYLEPLWPLCSGEQNHLCSFG